MLQRAAVVGRLFSRERRAGASPRRLASAAPAGARGEGLRPPAARTASASTTSSSATSPTPPCRRPSAPSCTSGSPTGSTSAARPTSWSATTSSRPTAPRASSGRLDGACAAACGRRGRTAGRRRHRGLEARRRRRRRSTCSAARRRCSPSRTPFRLELCCELGLALRTGGRARARRRDARRARSRPRPPPATADSSCALASSSPTSGCSATRGAEPTSCSTSPRQALPVFEAVEDDRSLGERG